MTLKSDSMFVKIWSLIQTYLLTLKQFDLCVQGALFLIILLETNVYLLLERDAKDGHHPALVGDWVRIGTSAVEFVLGTFIAWYGRNHKRLNLSCWMAATAVFSCLVLAFPYAVSNPAEVELCGGGIVSPYMETVAVIDNNVTGRTFALVLTAVLCTLVKVSIWAHGLTYLDDHAPDNGAYFYGILICIRLSLGLSGYNWLNPGSVRDDWWVAHLILSLLTALFAVFFILFPKRMPWYQEVGDSDVDTDFLVSFTRIVRNKRLVLQSIGLAFLNAACFGFVHYDKPYVQARFHLEAYRFDLRTSRAVTDIFRTLVIVFFIMIFRIRFSNRRVEGVKSNTASRVGAIVAIFVAVCFVVLSVVGCNVSPIAGLESGSSEPLTCSQDCGCDSTKHGFAPVCALDTRTTYFSPCDAGCSSYEDLGRVYLYHNCTCGSDRAVRGACSLPSCILSFNVYQVLYTLILAISGASMLMQGMSILRSVRSVDKPIAMGAAYALVALLAYVLGHLINMFISYVTCIHWWDGACLLHGTSLWLLGASSVVLTLLSAGFSLMASRVLTEKQVPTTEL